MSMVSKRTERIGEHPKRRARRTNAFTKVRCPEFGSAVKQSRHLEVCDSGDDVGTVSQ